jgi:hypothetical protein
MITIDDFVQRHNLTVGFMKADVEGHLFSVVKGARNTMIRNRPIFSFAVYHDFVEMYNVSLYLMNLLPNYQFDWHLETPTEFAFFELSIFGKPLESRRSCPLGN